MRPVTALGTGLAFAAVLLTSTGCGPGGRTVPTGAEAGSTGKSEIGAARQGGGATAADAGTGSGGAGTVTVSITEPVSLTGHAGDSVTCSTGRIYTAAATSAPVQGYKVSFTVRIAGYTGAGTYPSVVTFSLTDPQGTTQSIPAVPKVDAVLTDTGGSFTVSAATESGRTVSGVTTWTCS